MRRLLTLAGAFALVISSLLSTETYAQNVNVSGANVLSNGSYPTLQAAFAAINAQNQAGTAILVDIVGNTAEVGTAVLNQSAGPWTTLTLTPTGTRTITGNLAAPLIDLNGADNVTINGLNSGGNALTISNASTSNVAGTSTVRFINAAQNNLLTNCSILGSSTSAVGTAGGNVLISTSASGANSGNTIFNNNIGPEGANLPTKCVTSLGSASPNQNTGNIIDNNNIFDFFSATLTVAGINIQTNNVTTTITNNRIYQTAPRVFTTAGLRYNGILATPGGTGSATITGNTIGFGAANGTGVTDISGLTNTINGIQAPSTSTTVATTINNNTVSGFIQTTSTGTTGSGSGFIGISVGATAGFFVIGSPAGNTIGSLDGSSGIVINNTTVTANSWGFVGVLRFQLP
jgi:hypothetical protein